MSSINLLSWYTLVIFKAFLTFVNMHTLLGITMGCQLYQGYKLLVGKNKWYKLLLLFFLM